MMRRVTLLLTPLLLAAAAPAEKRALDIRYVGDDATTERFAEALRTALPASERLRAPDADDDDLALVILADVASEKKRFRYSVDLMKVNPGFSPDRLGSFEGKCREDELADCAGGILADAERAVRKAEKD
jgi:hypothetical protein